MAENAPGEFVDADPEYDADAASEIDAEAAEFEPADPESVPDDIGDAGQPEPPEEPGGGE
jgi:hypothetical protein